MCKKVREISEIWKSELANESDKNKKNPKNLAQVDYFFYLCNYFAICPPGHMAEVQKIV